MGFRKISIQEELVEAVRQYIEGSGSYRSIAEFVSEAIRLRLEQLKGLEETRRKKGQS
jgi:Arc/MetJ-type ribon-helix-helix transcriptional regulator